METVFDIGSGLNALGGVISNSIANQQNAAMARQAMEFNRQERLETQAWNEKMMREQMAYNTPAMQAQRLRDAGLNPSAVLGGNNTGQLQSTPQSTPASAPAMPTMMPLLNGSEFTEALKGAEEIMSSRAKREEDSARLVAYLEDRLLENRRKLVAGAKDEQELDMLRKEEHLLDLRLDAARFQASRQNRLAEMADQEFAAELKLKQLAYSSQKFQYDLAAITGLQINKAMIDNLVAQTHAIYERVANDKRITDAEVEQMSQQTKKLWEETLGISMDNDFVGAFQSVMHDERLRSNKVFKLHNYYDTRPWLVGFDQFLERLSTAIPMAAGFKPRRTTINNFGDRYFNGSNQ